MSLDNKLDFLAAASKKIYPALNMSCERFYSTLRIAGR